jgi:hypothetical protein
MFPHALKEDYAAALASNFLALDFKQMADAKLLDLVFDELLGRLAESVLNFANAGGSKNWVVGKAKTSLRPASCQGG